MFSVDPFGLSPERQEQEFDGTVHFVRHQKPSKSQVEANLERHGLTDRVTAIEGFSIDVAGTWSRPVGLLFIDGNHNQAREDFEAWKDHLVAGAIVVFHDTNYPERKHASKYVSQVVETLIAEYHLAVIARVDRLTTVRWESDNSRLTSSVP